MARLTGQIDCKATKGETKQCKTPATSKAIPTEVGNRENHLEQVTRPNAVVRLETPWWICCTSEIRVPSHLHVDHDGGGEGPEGGLGGAKEESQAGGGEES